ncbi:MAG: TolB family protein [Puniceicoccaceae bacterium]
MKPASYPYPESGHLELSDSFPRRVLETGRSVVQLTSGKAFCYPLYYFIPSFSRDLKYVVYHRAEAGEVQMYRLELSTGESVQLTSGCVLKTGWDHWDDEAGCGILDHRSVLNVSTGDLIYFDGEQGNEVHSVNIDSLEHKLLFTLPEDYYAGGQNCVSPDGRYLVYILNPIGSKYLEPLPDKPSKVVAYAFATGKQKTLCEVDFHIHHIIPYGNEHYIGCHTPNGCGIFMTSLSEFGYTILRAGDPGLKVTGEDEDIGGHACHYVCTEQGIAYEVIPFTMRAPRKDKTEAVATVKGGFCTGLYDPITRARFEFPLPDHFVGTHVGWDPKGRRWFWEIMPSWDQASANQIIYLQSLKSSGEADFLPLTPKWMNYGTKQKSHHHPQMTPDSNWLLFVAGDPETETNHLHLLDMSDLPETEGIGRELLSPDGVNDLKRISY